jgi:Ca2+-transporting ATPase
VTVGLCRMRGRLAWSSAAAAIASAVLLIQAEPLARLLHLSPLGAQDWLLAAGIGLAAGALAALLPVRRASLSDVRRRGTR